MSCQSHPRAAMDNDADILLSFSGNWLCKLNAITAKLNSP
jgi:hypothetical protein